MNTQVTLDAMAAIDHVETTLGSTRREARYYVLGMLTSPGGSAEMAAVIREMIADANEDGEI